MHSFEDVKEQIRRSVDLADVVSEHVSLKRAGRNLRGLCPFHHEKTPSFNVLPERQIFKCFGCDAGGDVFKFVQLIEKVDFPEALRILAQRVGIELRPAVRADGQGTPTVGRADLARANEWAAGWFRRQLLSEAGAGTRRYLESRRISPEMGECFQIGRAPGEGRLPQAAQQAGISLQLLLAADLVRRNEQGGNYETFRDRLMFPIRDGSNRCIGFGGRALGESPAKYLNTARNELFDKGRCLFGLPLAREEIHRRRCVVVVEGYTDCIACHQHGFPHTVATLGTAATDEHMRTLRRYTDTAILLFDSDAAGQAAAERALAIALQQNLMVKIARVPEGKDPADYLQVAGASEFGALLNSAVDALGFMWSLTQARFANAAGGSSRRQAVVEFVDLVGELSRFGAVDAIQRGMIIHQVARLLGLPVPEVLGLFTRQTRPARPAPVESGRPDTGPGSAERTGDAEERILAGILGILVCEPGLLGEVSGLFRAERFKDPALRHIAEVFLDLAERLGEFQASELLSALEAPGEARLVTNMILEGTERGNLATTLTDLRQRWERLEALQGSREASEKVKRGRSEGGQRLSDDEVDACLAAVQKGCVEHRHFVSPGRSSRGGKLRTGS